MNTSKAEPMSDDSSDFDGEIEVLYLRRDNSEERYKEFEKEMNYRNRMDSLALNQCNNPSADIIPYPSLTPSLVPEPTTDQIPLNGVEKPPLECSSSLETNSSTTTRTVSTYESWQSEVDEVGETVGDMEQLSVDNLSEVPSLHFIYPPSISSSSSEQPAKLENSSSDDSLL